jgi:ribosomal-protein-alanine N-acetyltransferase
VSAASSRTAGAVDIVPMRRRHLRAVLAIETLVYPTPWSMDLYRTELAASAGRTYRVALTGGSLVGYAGLMEVAGEGHVTTLAVDPQRQGQRIGTELLLHLLRAAQAASMDSVTLEVRAGNEPAQALYRRFGFTPAGIRRGYYQATGEDAVIMWAEEIQGPAFGDRLDAIAQSTAGSASTGAGE